MASKTYLDSINSPMPCSKDWNEMLGGDEKRFCSGCQKDVYNLSALSRNNARKLVAENSGQICVRYVRLADGRIETRTSRQHHILRPAAVAAGMLSAAIIVATASGQATSNNKPTGPRLSKQSSRKVTKTHRVEFLVLDPMNNPIGKAEVELTRDKSTRSYSTVTNEKGIALFHRLPSGRFKARFSAMGFHPGLKTILVTLAAEPTIQFSLEVSVSVGVVTIDPYEVPLFDYIAKGDNSTVKKFLLKGFDVKTQSFFGYTALHVAVEHGNLEIIRLLLNKRADVNKKTKDKRTPLLMLGDYFEYEEEGDTRPLEILRLLISHGANVNEQDEDGLTLLMMAAENDSLTGVRDLIEAGAKTDLKDKDGESALDKTESEEIKQLLKTPRRKK